MMKKHYLLLLILFTTFTGFSQITFEKGYIIDESNNTIPVFIRFSELAAHPNQISYRHTPDGEIITAGPSSIKEFGVGENYKYVRKKVQIDKSPQSLKNISQSRSPKFVEETVFLKTLLEGELTLLAFNGKYQGYFIEKSDGNIEALIYKKYSTGDNIIRKNNRYKQQLLNLLPCKDINVEKLMKVNYTSRDLTKILQKYHQCIGEDPKIYKLKREGELNLMAKAGLNFTNFGMENDIYNTVDEFNYDIDPRIGLEIEYILPMVNRKVAVYMEPSLSMYKSDQEIIVPVKQTSGSNPDGPGGYKAMVNMEYYTFDIPLGLRFYMYLNKETNTKIFFNGGASINLVLNSSTILNQKNAENEDFDFNQSWEPGFFGGVGIRFREKVSIETRYFPVRPLTDNGGYKLHQNHSFAIVAGYTIN
jgi:hypothetical protein